MAISGTLSCLLDAYIQCTVHLILQQREKLLLLLPCSPAIAVFLLVHLFSYCCNARLTSVLRLEHTSEVIPHRHTTAVHTIMHNHNIQCHDCIDCRNKSTETVSFPLTVMSLLTTSSWATYGTLIMILVSMYR